MAILTVFHSEFTDGTEVITSNNRTARVTPPFGTPIHVFVFPEVLDPARLLDVHRALVGRFEAGRTRRDPIAGDPIAFRDRIERRQLDHQVALGYYRRDPDGKVQRPTWKGAFLMTWRLLWPSKPIRLALRRREARRLLRDLEAEGRLPGGRGLRDAGGSV